MKVGESYKTKDGCVIIIVEQKENGDYVGRFTDVGEHQESIDQKLFAWDEAGHWVLNPNGCHDLILD